jgi:large subunit ribosomal protein L9
MKVILLQEVKGRGGEGDVIDVARGYAVNFLFPRKIAIEATKGNVKQLEARRHNIEKREAQRLDTADKLLAALDEKTLTVRARVGDEGQLFGSVTTAHIADALLEQMGAEIDRKKIDLHAPIKSAGDHYATVTIYRDVKATVTVRVVDEKAKDDEPAAEAAEAAEAEAAEAAEEALGAEAAEPAEAEDAEAAEAVEPAEDAEAAEEAAEADTADDAIATDEVAITDAE